MRHRLTAIIIDGSQQMTNRNRVRDHGMVCRHNGSERTAKINRDVAFSTSNRDGMAKFLANSLLGSTCRFMSTACLDRS